MFHTYKQYDTADCGVACLRMVARHYGKRYSERELASMCHPTRNGVSMLDISEAAGKIGMRAVGVRLPAQALANGVRLPCILHWNGHHFVVCHKTSHRHGKLRFHIADPASKRLVYTEEELANCWCHGGGGNATGVALLLEPTAEFYQHEPQQAHSSSSTAFILHYMAQHRRELAKILLAMLIVSILQLAAPYLTQALVDVGIGRHSTEIIKLILVAQLTILVSSVVVGMIRNWVTLYMNTRINITLVSDFLIKIMRMPLRFFDARQTGDIIQRMRDNDRIEEFLTGSSVETMFSMLNFVVFAIILAFYDLTILLTFVVGNAMYVAWTQCLMNRRRDLDLKRFNQLADEQDITLQIIHGIRDIKLSNCERQKLWEWERLQAKIFGIKQKTLSVAQLQQFVTNTPSGFATKVGADGMGLSQGQKQRLLIARAVYKRPQILVLDEATNALDSKTEKRIIDNLQTFYKGRTVVIAAHRLSTIINADNIVVVADGRIAEQGTHSQLIERRGEYYSLVANQMYNI